MKINQLGKRQKHILERMIFESLYIIEIFDSQTQRTTISLSDVDNDYEEISRQELSNLEYREIFNSYDINKNTQLISTIHILKREASYYLKELLIP